MQETKNELLKHVKDLTQELLNFPWENKKSYANWLAQTYFYVRHTTCFLALSADAWGVKNREKQYKTLSHLRQELSHDLLLLEDLQSLGDSIQNHHEWPETQAFYQTQYYWIERETPAAHLGYAYLLEGVAHFAGPSICKQLTKAYGSQGASFLNVHAEEDTLHFEDGLSFLETFTEVELKVFRECLRQADLLYRLILARSRDLATPALK